MQIKKKTTLFEHLILEWNMDVDISSWYSHSNNMCSAVRSKTDWHIYLSFGRVQFDSVVLSLPFHPVKTSLEIEWRFTLDDRHYRPLNHFIKEQESKHCSMEITSLHCKITNCTLSIKLSKAGSKRGGHMVKARRGWDFTANYLRDLLTDKPDAYNFIPNESYGKCIVLQPSVLIQSQHAQNTSLRYYTSNKSVHNF